MNYKDVLYHDLSIIHSVLHLTFISLHSFAPSIHSFTMKFSPVALLLASASALTLPTQGDQDGAAQYPQNTVTLGGGGWGGPSQGSSSSWSSFPAQDPYASYNPYQNNPYSSNPYQPYDPYASQQYPPPNPYNAPPPPPPVPPPPPPPIPPPPPPYNGPDPNAPIIPVAAGDIPQQVTIEKTGYSGNGCPAGTVSTLLSPDKTVVTFGFDTFQATIGPNSNPSDKQKNCQLHLGLRYPAGYQLSIMTATYHGYVRLDPGVNANFISSYYFSQAAEKTVCTFLRF
jgi:Domain of unknown function (DUF4360)